MDVLDTVFGKEYKNLEFTGLDFKQFYMLMQSVDFVYIYGKKSIQFLEREVIFYYHKEFNGHLDAKLYADIIIDNIDDCKMDIKEEEEKPDKKTLWGE